MEKTLSLEDLYHELEENPDLRRLGQYRVIAKGSKPVLPIDVNLEGRDVNLGEGDFTDSFVAFAETRARGLDLSDCAFTDLYLDNMKVDTLHFSESKASRLFFDYAKINNCEFGNFSSPELYFDEAEIENILMQNLRSGVVYLAKLKAANVVSEGENKVYKFLTDLNGTKSFGNFTIVETETVGSVEEGSEAVQKVRSITLDELIDELKKDSDLRRLGKYQVVPEGDGSSVVDMDLEGKDIFLGEGDFTKLPEGLSFAGTSAKSVDFDKCRFSELSLGSLKAERIDLSRSKSGWLTFNSAIIGECFFSDFEGDNIDGGEAKIENIFGERGITHRLKLDSMTVGQFNINNMQIKEFRLDESQIRELYMSNGKGVQDMFFSESQIELLNLHESSMHEVHFEWSKIHKALINKCSVEKIYCDELDTELLFIARHKNELGEIDFSEMKDVSRVEIEAILPQTKEQGAERKATYKRLSFGNEPEEWVDGYKEQGGRKIFR